MRRKNRRLDLLGGSPSARQQRKRPGLASEVKYWSKNTEKLKEISQKRNEKFSQVSEIGSNVAGSLGEIIIDNKIKDPALKGAIVNLFRNTKEQILTLFK